ncbi:MAG: hypothetical protein UCO57_01450 [Gemmiger sp.]|uniref:hypothetical protein n=1 Tax=Gemmiger sp. TaxID=2049027 RepID=UPI002E796059|nr:hypothetical protein [Gemmiger sp.]MEE0707431.1 hypothetical protein [Gemmiger sp.]
MKDKIKAFMRLGKLQISVFIQKKRKVIWALVILAVIVVVWKSFEKIVEVSTGQDETTITVAGTLLGAIIGGILSLYGSIWVNSRQQRAAQNIKVKKQIYSPLYDELKEIEDEFLAQGIQPYSIEISREKESHWGGTCFSAWERIKSDTRYLEVPDSLKAQIEALGKVVLEYLAARSELDVYAKKAIDNVLQQNGQAPCKVINLEKLIAYNVLEGKTDELSYITSDLKKDVDKQLCQKIESEVWAQINESPQKEKVDENYRKWKQVHSQTIKMLELMIKKVNLKYED